jgi:hypothetical protein
VARTVEDTFEHGNKRSLSPAKSGEYPAGAGGGGPAKSREACLPRAC